MITPTESKQQFHPNVGTDFCAVYADILQAGQFEVGS
jgi:hypothetical protein